MIIKAKLNKLRISARKVRLVADMIRGKPTEKAAAILSFTKRVLVVMLSGTMVRPSFLAAISSRISFLLASSLRGRVSIERVDCPGWVWITENEALVSHSSPSLTVT